MNRLKSWYISLYVTFVMVAAAHSVYMLVITGVTIAWLGSAVANVPMMLLFAYIFIADKARLSRNLIPVFTFVIGGAAFGLYGAIDSFECLPFFYAEGALVGFLVYNYWYSRFDRSNAILTVGNILPDVNFEDESGKLVSSQSFLGSPALLMFYRGNWCPFCTAQVKEITRQYQEFTSRGVQIAFISPQPHKNTRQLSERFSVDCMFLVDKDNKAAEALNIVSPGGTPAGMEVLGYETDTVLPTVLITDKEGKIIFADLTDNYRVRPEPAMFLQALDQAGI